MEREYLQKLRDLPIEGVAERLGLHVSRHKALCPFHDDHHASLSFNMRNNTCRCFVCMNHSIGTIDLVMQVRRVGFREATEWLIMQNSQFIIHNWGHAERQGEGLRVQGFKGSRGESQDNVNVNVNVNEDSNGFKRFQKDSKGESQDNVNVNVNVNEDDNENENQKAKSYLKKIERRIKSLPYGGSWEGAFSPAAKQFLFDERKIDPRVVRWCRLSSWKDKKGVNWLTIPYFDQEGNLTGVQYRNLEPGGTPRFRFPYGSRCGIYNLQVLPLLRPDEPLFITEGCSDCWAMLSAGHKAIAIPSATLLNASALEALLQVRGESGEGLRKVERGEEGLRKVEKGEEGLRKVERG